MSDFVLQAVEHVKENVEHKMATWFVEPTRGYKNSIQFHSFLKLAIRVVLEMINWIKPAFLL